ncbi:MAG: hypothetical protein M4579_001962 [Chaenotheca gracillima]|nr:MAG: hypothetical protein M4579_001962 [Chaenotheca gracillima]
MDPCAKPLPLLPVESWNDLPVEYRPRDFEDRSNRRFLSPDVPRQQQASPRRLQRRIRHKSFDETTSNKDEMSRKKKNLRALFGRRARSNPCSDSEDDGASKIDYDDDIEDEEFKIDLSNLCPPPETSSTVPAARRTPRRIHPRVPTPPLSPRTYVPASPRYPPQQRRSPSPGSSQLIWLPEEEMWLRAEFPDPQPSPPLISRSHTPPTRPSSSRGRSPRSSIDGRETTPTPSRTRPRLTISPAPESPGAPAASPRPLPVETADDSIVSPVSAATVPPPCYIQSQWEEACRRSVSGDIPRSRWDLAGVRLPAATNTLP